MVSLLAVFACEKDLSTPVDTPETISASEELPPNITMMTGEEMIGVLSKTYGDVSEKTGQELVDLYSELKNRKETEEYLNEVPDKKAAAANNDVYSSALIAFTIPFDGAPPNLYNFYIDNTPPLIGCPSTQSVRTLNFYLCPNFVQITTTANVYKNNSSISGVSDTERAPFGCGGRQVRSFARAIIYPFCSATTQASISCDTRIFGPFCAIVIDDPVKF